MSDPTQSTPPTFDDRIARAVDNIVRPLHGVLETELRSLVSELAAKVAEEQGEAQKQARDAAVAEKEAAVRDALDAAGIHHEKRIAELQQVSSAEKDAALAAMRGTLEQEGAASLAAAVAAARGEADASLAAAVAAAKADAEASLASLREDADRRLEAARADARAGERQADLACADRLLDVIRRIDRAGSLTEILDVLGDHARGESGRVAVFLVRESTLRGWRFGGFAGSIPDPHAIEVPLGQSGVIGRAVMERTCAATSDVASDQNVAYAPPPPESLLYLPAGRAGFAVPLSVGGQVVAVLYADEGTVEEPTVPSAWPELVEITARHASRCLELLMAARIVTARVAHDVARARGGHAGAPVASAPPAPPPVAPPTDEDEEASRRYARLLISEIKLYHEAEVNVGKREHDLAERLKPEIERARRLYHERVAPATRVAADCFEEELVRTLADGNPALLGTAT